MTDLTTKERLEQLPREELDRLYKRFAVPHTVAKAKRLMAQDKEMTFKTAKDRYDKVQVEIFELERRQAEFDMAQASEKLRLLAELKLAHDELLAFIQ